jgi:hypothetical protein
MKRIAAAFVMLAAATLPPGCAPVTAGPLDETRYCTVTPKRDKDGSISRRADVLAAFKRHHPCPSTGKTRGACPGFAIDHVIPLANGGCDSVHNLQWLPHELKSCPKVCKDRWERDVYKPRNPEGATQ